MISVKRKFIHFLICVKRRVQNHHYLHHLFVLFADSFGVVLAGILMAVSLAAFSDHNHLRHFFLIIGLLIPCSLVLFRLSQAYKFSIHHLSMGVLMRLISVLIILALGIFTFEQTVGCIHDSIIAAALFLPIAFTFVIGLRLIMVKTYDIAAAHSTAALCSDGSSRDVFILGDADAAANFATFVKECYSDQFNPVGIIDPDLSITDLYVHDFPVYGKNDREKLEKLLHGQYSNAAILLFRQSLRKAIPQISDWCSITSIQFFIIPPFCECNPDTPLQLRSLKIEDLLERPEIQIDDHLISEQITGKCIMVTGAAGSIGSELVRQLSRFRPARLILLDNAETPLHNISLEVRESFPDQDYLPIVADVRNKRRCSLVVSQERPEIIFHAAAYKHVPLMESNPCEAVLDNVGGSMNMAEIARENNVKRFVMVSTDKAVNPTNVMGATKRTAEMYVQSLNSHLRTTDESCTRYVTTRFGNVLGSNGSVVPRFREQIAKGGPVTVTHPDIIRYFMTIPEACRLVLQAATMGDGGDIFVFDMGEPVKIANLARRMILLSGLQPNEDIKIVYTGLRPGEKLFEEVLTDNESTTETHHEKIRIARPCNTQFEVVAEQVHNLLAKADQFDAAGTVNALKHLVPNFISRNSPWEEFDLTAEHPALPTDVPEIRQTVV
jgi:FlaA1/EpsC-like NDP-sugar epimerase